VEKRSPKCAQSEKKRKKRKKEVTFTFLDP
jgi:hypothetical protein